MTISEFEQVALCEFRRVTRHYFDDVFIVFKDKIPALTRSNLHSCFVRHNLNVLSKFDTETGQKSLNSRIMHFICESKFFNNTVII